MIYLLDTNAISAYSTKQVGVTIRFHDALRDGDTLGLCQPVLYEIMRGLLWQGASGKLRVFNQRVLPYFAQIPLVDADWQQAAQLWANARRQGRQLSDPDLILAAIAMRLQAVLVSADADFDALPVTREDWQK